MTIVVNGMRNKAIGRLLLEGIKGEDNPIEFIEGTLDTDHLTADIFFADAEWQVTTGTCKGTEFVEIKKMSGESKFMFVLTSGEFDSITIA